MPVGQQLLNAQAGERIGFIGENAQPHPLRRQPIEQAGHTGIGGGTDMPRAARVGGRPLRDAEVLAWARRLVEDVLLGAAAAAAAAAPAGTPSA